MLHSHSGALKYTILNTVIFFLYILKWTGNDKKMERGSVFWFFLILDQYMWFLSELSPHSLHQLTDQAQVFLNPFIYLVIDGGVSVFLKIPTETKTPTTMTQALSLASYETKEDTHKVHKTTTKRRKQVTETEAGRPQRHTNACYSWQVTHVCASSCWKCGVHISTRNSSRVLAFQI